MSDWIADDGASGTPAGSAGRNGIGVAPAGSRTGTNGGEASPEAGLREGLPSISRQWIGHLDAPPADGSMNTRVGEDLVTGCWRLLAEGRPYQALDRAERALRIYRPPMDTLLAGRLYLIVGVSLAALGRRKAANHYLRDASWALENAWDCSPGRPAPGAPGKGGN